MAPDDFPAEWGITSLAVAPAGSNAIVVSNNIPTTMAPGERLNVRVTMQNSGTVDWSTASWVLYRQNSAWSWVYDPVIPPILAGNNSDFDFVITAPTTPGAATYSARMLSLVSGQSGYFGETITVPVTVDAAATPRWSCGFVSSTVPATMAPGSQRAVSITVQNTGTGTWASSGLCLYSRDSPVGRWGRSICTPLTQTVAPGANVTFNMTIVAPTTPGIYELDRQMFDGNAPNPVNGVGMFNLLQNCVDLSVNVTAAGAAYDATLVSEDFPTTMSPGQVSTVSVVMANAGTATWPTDGSVVLASENTPTSLWGVTSAVPQATTAPAANGTFTLSVVAPATPGSYNHRWRLFSSTNGFFGPAIDIPVTVAGGTAYDAAVVSQNIPASIVVGTRVNFEVTMQNTGTFPWDTVDFGIRSDNTPVNLWRTVFTPLPAATTVAPGQQYTFIFEVVAPSIPGTYDSSWFMYSDGTGDFGAVAFTGGISVVPPAGCGDGVIGGTETCDDGNTTPGDGCSAACLIENQALDLAVTAADRTIWGTVSSKALANVAMGDVTDDGTVDVVMAEYSHVYPSYNPNGKAQVGRVYGFSGASFLTGATTQGGTGAGFEVWGADPNDKLGGGYGSSVLIGDVTGDGVADVVVSAAAADGEGNTRTDAGEIYVIIGQTGLASAGVIDLGTTTATSSGFVGARIIGPAAGGFAHGLAINDFNGDGIGDIVVAVPLDDTAAADAGAVMLVAGGANLATVTTIDLGVPVNAFATIYGPGAGDQLGYRGATGLVDGNAVPDLMLGTPLHDPAGRSNAGAAWALLGPLSGTYNLPGDADIVWYGEGANDRYGYSISIGNVRGTAAADVVIGGTQIRNASLQQVGAADIWQGPITGTTFDLSTGALPNSRILGADQYDNAGTNISAVGDMNGDGYNEILIVSSVADGPANLRDRAGEVAVVLGASSIPASVTLNATTSRLLVYGADAVGLMGHHPNNLAVGDLDGDGRADFCVGSPQGGSSLGALIYPGRVDCIRSRW